jgi:hypothetical protein
MKRRSNLWLSVLVKFALGMWCLIYATEGRSTIQVTLTPVDPPITILVNGGSFDYHIDIENVGSSSVTFDAWIEAVLPNGSLYGPIILRDDLVLPVGGLLTRAMTQTVPSSAPWGTYTYRCNAGAYPDSIVDSDEFTFFKNP